MRLDLDPDIVRLALEVSKLEVPESMDSEEEDRIEIGLITGAVVDALFD